MEQQSFTTKPLKTLIILYTEIFHNFFVRSPCCRTIFILLLFSKFLTMNLKEKFCFHKEHQRLYPESQAHVKNIYFDRSISLPKMNIGST